MTRYKFRISLDATWEFDIEANNEDEAYERLWDEVGYDAEDIMYSDWEPESEYMDIDIRVLTP